ncbi:solute carrier family 22 member 7-like isoform X3 [Rhipicephalus microplus]|uniref:solute carrier family 22 member 7-like isoform X3 n=1 Tax=Rhipicephalus microplus TaxID=6941 RepID=UPI003F6CC411
MHHPGGWTCGFILWSTRSEIMVGTDDIFNQLGPWHYPLLAFCFLRGFPAAYHAMAPTFTAPQLNHWCAKPSQLANWSTERWLENAVPWEERKGSQKRSQCEMYVYEEGADGSITFFNNSRVKCLAWEYDLGDKTYTLTDTFDLVCDRVWLRTASQSIYMAGIMIGNTVFSHLSDWYGRRQSLLLSMPLPIMAGLLTTFARTFWLYNIGRLIASIGVGGIQNATLTIGAHTEEAYFCRSVSLPVFTQDVDYPVLQINIFDSALLRLDLHQHTLGH